MSDSTDESGSEGEQLYSCLKCPNKTFTAAEKDSHRRMHKRAKLQGKAGRVRHRAPSPTNTDVTLFQPLPETPEGSPAGTPLRQSKTGAPKKKRRSTKNYDSSVSVTSSSSGG